MKMILYIVLNICLVYTIMNFTFFILDTIYNIRENRKLNKQKSNDIRYIVEKVEILEDNLKELEYKKADKEFKESFNRFDESYKEYREFIERKNLNK